MSLLDWCVSEALGLLIFALEPLGSTVNRLGRTLAQTGMSILEAGLTLRRVRLSHVERVMRRHGL